MLEQASIYNSLNFDAALIQLSFQCVHLIHAKVFSIQILHNFQLSHNQLQIMPRVCTLVLYVYLLVFFFFTIVINIRRISYRYPHNNYYYIT